MSAWATGARLGARRLAHRSVTLALLGSLALVVIAAALERRAALSRATDTALLGAAFGVAVPLMVYALASRVFAGGRTQDAVESLARHGLDRRWGTLGLLAAGAGAAAASSLAISVTAVLCTTRGAPPVAELTTCAWIGVLGGLAYFLVFAAGATFGKRGGGCWLVLALDWLLGMSTTVAALPWPRGHLRNLLGAAPVAHMSQWHASVALLLIVLAGVCVSLLRTPH